jgi:hypothetical protein
MRGIKSRPMQSYLHVGVRQSWIADNRRAAIDNLVITRTTMLALVMPGWLLRVGLMPLTCCKCQHSWSRRR